MHDITAFGQHTRSDDIGRGMRSSPLGNTDGRTTLGVACHHRPWTTNTVKRCRAWYAIIAFGQHRRSNDVGRGLPSTPLGGKHSRTTSGVTYHHRLWTSGHSRTASAVAYLHCPWTANMVERCRAWHAIITFGHHIQSNDVGRGMPS